MKVLRKLVSGSGRWVAVTMAAILIVVISYELLLPQSEPEERRFPADHGAANLVALDLPQEELNYYRCMLSWVEQNTDRLRIGDDFFFEPDVNFNGSRTNGFRIEAVPRFMGLRVRVTGSGSYPDGSFWVNMRAGSVDWQLAEPRPCDLPKI